MHLRDLPQLKYRGHPIWPPTWNKTKDSIPTVVGEVGVLKFVHSHRGGSLRCYIVMEHENEKYVGDLLFDDPALARQITVLLRTNVGRTLKEIGDIEVA